MAPRLALLLTILILEAAIFTIAEQRKEDKMYFLNKGTKGNDEPKLLVVSWSENEEDGVGDCELFIEKDFIEKQLDKAPKVEEVTDEEMQDIIEECNEIKTRRKRQTTPMVPNREIESEEPDSSTDRPDAMAGPSKTTTEGYDGWNVIFPGTKWCGAGDVARSYSDLGLLADTDKCCRAHDLCNDTLAPGATRNNLTNNSPFTKLSCKCDDDFYKCLERVDSIVSNKIGNVYFNILKRTCYEYDYPLTRRCKTFRSFLKITCKEYAKNTRAPKVYQWRKAKLYKKLPLIPVELPF